MFHNRSSAAHWAPADLPATSPQLTAGHEDFATLQIRPNETRINALPWSGNGGGDPTPPPWV